MKDPSRPSGQDIERLPIAEKNIQEKLTQISQLKRREAMNGRDSP
jgi:hypothetical protein